MGQELSRLGMHESDSEKGELPSPSTPPPRFSSTIWLASCRPAGRLSSFARPVLYQPDTRLFCPHGASCRQRHVDPAHARLCIHTQAAMDGSARTTTELVNPAPIDKGSDGQMDQDDDEVEEDTDNEDGEEEKGGGCGASPLWIPHVRYAYDVSKAALADPNADALAGLPRNRTVVIYVHGFRADDQDTHSFRTIGCLLHLQLRLREGQAALQHRRNGLPDASTGSSQMRESAAAAVADAVGAAAVRQRHEDWDGWAAAQHPVIAGGLLTEQGRRVRLSSHESEDIVLSAPNSPVPCMGSPAGADDAATDNTAEPAATAELQRRAIMQRRTTAQLHGSSADSGGSDRSGNDEDAPIIMGFVWPCHNKTTAYRKARDKAARAGEVLRPLLETLSARGNTVLLVAHSMGARVALTALLEEKPAKAPDIVFDNPINSLEPEPEPEPEDAAPPEAAGGLAPADSGVAAAGTLLWREGQGIVFPSDAAAVDAKPVKLAVEGDNNSSSDHNVTSGNNINLVVATPSKPDSRWTCAVPEQTPPPSTKTLGSGVGNGDCECVLGSAGANRTRSPHLVSHVFLLAGAVSADALHRGRGEFSLDRLRADNITVAHSSNDSVLRDAFWVGESMPALRAGGGSAMKINPRRPSSFRGGAAGALAHARDARDATKTAATAIGFQGPTEATLRSECAQLELDVACQQRQCAALRTVDVTGSVRSHRVNQWLGSAEISLRIAAAVQAAAVERSELQGGAGSIGNVLQPQDDGEGCDGSHLVPTEEELKEARCSATSSICTPTKAAAELDDESDEAEAPEWGD